MADISLIDRLLDVIEHDIVPKTAEGVAHGNKLFGAAIPAFSSSSRTSIRIASQFPVRAAVSLSRKPT